MYLDLAVLLNMTVDYLLLMGTMKLAGTRICQWRMILAAGMGGVYAGLCLLPGWRFFGGIFWRCVILCLMVVVAYGWRRTSVKMGLLFLLLNLILSGSVMLIGAGSFLSILVVSTGVFLLGSVGLPRIFTPKKILDLELDHNGSKSSLRALYDTGNQLRDPISGRSVIVVGPSVAKIHFGLTEQDLSSPLETLGKPGETALRLIPYSGVGTRQGFLLAAAFQRITVNGRPCSGIVAFSPCAIGNGRVYDALIGGNLI